MAIVLPFSTSTKKVAILGGGVTGLAAAYRLAKMGHIVRLFEQTNRLGGVIRTEMTDGWLVEAGPQSLRETSPLISMVMRGISVHKARVDAAPESNRRYIVRRGRPVAMPTSPGSILFSSLFTPWGKLRVLGDLLRRPRPEAPDCSFSDFVRMHCGKEAADYVAQSLAAGIYAGDADLLSARHAFPRLWDYDHLYGSFLRGHEQHLKACEKRHESSRSTIFSFQRGMQTLTHAFVLQLPADVIALNARVEALVPGPRWQVIWRDLRGREGSPEDAWSKTDDGGRQVEGFDAVISALPALAMSRLEFGERNECPLAALAELPHAAMASLFLGYRRDQVAHPLDGYGVLSPPREKRKLLGVVFSSSTFPGRAPEGHVALTVMAGGIRQPELARLSQAELLAAVTPDLRALLGIRGEPVFQRHTAWPRAIPQYNLGHVRFNQAMHQCEKKYRGFFLGGHVRDGVSVSDCILSGERLAEKAAAYEPLE
jgi:protoporphyrinogen/coproporphyrinogen III oxidase